MTKPLWTVARPADLCWRDWDELGAIYDDGSGSTHLADALSIELLALLAQRPHSVTALVETLADALPENMGADIAAAFFERQLQALQDLALVRQLPPSA
ncbi:MAG: hypothetical protein DI603_15575 [Roseateles depolymerans]|uniref:HPr-rel-A system PqqD family peptide chaperone n=1 Tax=Roseateles depolymerans TaxID=76731 RepID=A0A2W5DM37_9BURK|nr:MAG: hypothetical protein DI603_15575 [Roseateles depolymerans]